MTRFQAARLLRIAVSEWMSKIRLAAVGSQLYAIGISSAI
jgi:hypothetical protein